MKVDNIVREIFELENLYLELDKKGNILRKSSKFSEESRKEGNQFYIKKKHNKDDHRNTLSQYTQSIAFAPTNSEEMALGFSNRSALLLHLHYYEKCMFDIDKALEITKSDKLKLKLESRKKKCMSLMNNNKTQSLKNSANNSSLNQENAIEKEMVRSKEIPSAAESVSLKYDEIFGRYLIANRNIKPGEIVIVEKGYACYPKYEEIYLTCSHCLTFAWNAIPCDFCAFAVYCDETCKKEAWEEYHDIECPLLKYLHMIEDVRIVDTILANRIFIKAVKAEGFNNVINETHMVYNGDELSGLLSNGILDGNKFRTCYNLQCHSSEFELDNVLYKNIIIFLLIKHTNLLNIEGDGYFFTKNDEMMIIQLKNMFSKLSEILDVNGFEYQFRSCSCSSVPECNENCDSIRGTVIAPNCSFVNHSCMSNVNRFFMQRRQVVFYSCRPIQKGEQLFCNYGQTVANEYTSRQEYLMEQFHFECLCPACTENITLSIDKVYKEISPKITVDIFSDFFQLSKDNKKSPFYKQSMDNWTVFNKELIGQAVTLIELAYKHSESYSAFIFSLPYMFYLSKAFFKLYGEKLVMPDHC